MDFFTCVVRPCLSWWSHNRVRSSYEYSKLYFFKSINCEFTFVSKTKFCIPVFKSCVSICIYLKNNNQFSNMLFRRSTLCLPKSIPRYCKVFYKFLSQTKTNKKYRDINFRHVQYLIYYIYRYCTRDLKCFRESLYTIL